MKTPSALIGLVLLAGVSTAMTDEKAILGGGCFWCVEAVYHGRPGIKSVVSGFAGGHVPNPTYEQVCTGKTGHAEVVEITFDPALISYEQVLDLFWAAHDPTTPDRQGADHGTQYRSIIVAANPAQRAIAEKSKVAAQARFKDPIITEIVGRAEFYPAEGFHQDFYERNPGNPYCRAVIAPKLEKLKSAGH
ncbi:MAG: peptide-methionine (S)-S-oxide reductase MsrA [Verrucomicrobiae bacterium]